MRACRLFLLAFLIIITTMQTAHAQGWSRRYGGRGEDRLYQLVAAQDGLLAAGYTYSTDGDLAHRTRTGKAGWLLRLDAQGDVLWSYTSAHVGRDEFFNPYVHGDGTISAVLRGADGQGQEWVILSEGGKVLSRVEVPGAQALCAHGGVRDVWPGIPTERDGERLLAVVCAHEDGSLCCAALDEQGGIGRGASFAYDAQDVIAAGAQDRLLQIGKTEEGLRVRWIIPGGAQLPQEHALAAAGGRIDVLLDALAYEDGSAIVSAQLEGMGDIIARVTEAGELLYTVDAGDNIYPLTATQSGFAGCSSSSVCFYDEDGALIGLAPLPRVDGEDGFVQDMAAFDGGAALLQESSGGGKTIQITAVTQMEPARDETYDEAIWLQSMAALLSARNMGDETEILCEYDGRAMRTLVDAQGNAQALAEAQRPHGYAVEGGCLLFEETPGGALVSLMDAQGNPCWQTRTLIHTAADRLIWRCGARTADGGYLLGGCYIIGSGDEARQTGVMAELSAQGVLQEIFLPGELTCVCAILPGDTPKDTVVLAALNEWLEAEAVVAARLHEIEWGRWTRTPIDLQTKDAYLLRSGDGRLLAAGTSIRHGRENVVLFALDWPEMAL
ncbi:MAG: hypothetical protein J6M47_08990 [Clostridia bacterium]|nr:hypothetical protein [Clostridia bacterium]